VTGQLQDRVAVVTGAGRGIGRAIALAFAREGADLVVAGRTVPELEEAAARVREQGRRALVVRADMTQEEEVARLAETTCVEFPRVDILVNNAGWGTFKPVVELTLAEWEGTIAVNLRSTFLGARAFAPVMIRQRHGCILNVSSMAAYQGAADYAPYSAAKAGILRLTEALAAELKPYGIRALALCPGPTASRLRSHHFPEEDPSTIMQPETVAEVAVFAASDAAHGISRTHLNVNHY
jgi:3-oxoacyl-[acyl-carrier protein] reductase